MNGQLYYGIDGERYGPVSMDELRAMIRDGRLRTTDYIWDTEGSRWIRVSDYPGIAAAGEPGISSTGEPGGVTMGQPGAVTMGEPGAGGADLGSTPGPASDPQSKVHRPLSPYEEFQATGGRMHADEMMPSEYAGFWIRVAAYFIDGIVLMVPSFFWLLLLSMVGLASTFGLEGLADLDPEALDDDFLGDAYSMLYLAGSFVITWLYFAGFEASPWQATVGKKVMAVRVVDQHGNRCGFGRTSLRFFIKFFASSIMAIGYLMVAFTQKKQGLHDIVADTFVVK